MSQVTTQKQITASQITRLSNFPIFSSIVWGRWQVNHRSTTCHWSSASATADTEKENHGRGGHGRGSSPAAARSELQSCCAGSCSGCHSGSQALQPALLARTGTGRVKMPPCLWGPGEAWGSPRPGSSEAWPWDPGRGRRGPAGSPCKRLSGRCFHQV